MKRTTMQILLYEYLRRPSFVLDRSFRHFWEITMRIPFAKEDLQTVECLVCVG